MNLLSIAALSDVGKRIDLAANGAGRKPSEITLIAVSKTFGLPDILPVLQAGQMEFGENRVQEAAGKWPDLLGSHTGVKLHLIGPLQTNKAADAVRLFDAIHTIDRPRIAAAVGREMAKQGRALKLFIQINTGDETQKSGVALAQADGFIDACRKAHGLTIAGLMCIPPLAENPERHFSLLASMAQRQGIKELSMGMSSDFELAIKLGATHVRVGSAIFGAR